MGLPSKVVYSRVVGHLTHYLLARRGPRNTTVGYDCRNVCSIDALVPDRGGVLHRARSKLLIGSERSSGRSRCRSDSYFYSARRWRRPRSCRSAHRRLLPVGERIADPSFGTTIRRVSDASGRGGFETHVYSQLQAFSDDNRFLLLDGSDGIIVRRVDDLSTVQGLDTSGWNAPRWHPTRPHVLVHFDSNADSRVLLQETNLDDLSTTTLFAFPERYQTVLGSMSWEEMSRDGVWTAAALVRDDDETVITSLNLDSKTLGAELAIQDLFASACEPDPVWGVLEPDWIGVSPLGNYLVVQWARDGVDRCSGLETFDLATGDFVGRVYDGHQHGDLGVDSDGESEFFMTTEFSSPEDNNRPALAIRSLPGTETVSEPDYLRVMDWADLDHISCQGPHGVCLVSWGRSDDPEQPLKDEIFMIRTDGSVVRLVHHQSSKCGYWVQPRASISRDGSLAVFASDWGAATGAESCASEFDLRLSDPYIIEIPTGS